MNIKEGEDIKLLCETEGSPIPTINWFKVSTVVDKSQRSIQYSARDG